MKKILVIDDETSIRELLLIILKREGYNVLSAEDDSKDPKYISTVFGFGYCFRRTKG